MISKKIEIIVPEHRGRFDIEDHKSKLFMRGISLAQNFEKYFTYNKKIAKNPNEKIGTCVYDLGNGYYFKLFPRSYSYNSLNDPYDNLYYKRIMDYSTIENSLVSFPKNAVFYNNLLIGVILYIANGISMDKLPKTTSLESILNPLDKANLFLDDLSENNRIKSYQYDVTPRHIFLSDDSYTLIDQDDYQEEKTMSLEELKHTNRLHFKLGILMSLLINDYRWRSPDDKNLKLPFINLEHFMNHYPNINDKDLDIKDLLLEIKKQLEEYAQKEISDLDTFRNTMIKRLKNS